MKVGDIVVFRENHKWVGSIGFINKIKRERIMVAVPAPMAGVAYIFCEAEDIEDMGCEYPYEIRGSEEE